MSNVDTRSLGSLIAIGGAEQKDPAHPMPILREVAQRTWSGGGTLVLVPTATRFVNETVERYTQVFRALGVPDVRVLDAPTRKDVARPQYRALLRDAAVVFFTGGDQRRIARRLRGTVLHEALWELFVGGGTIAGTSAGAAAMAETMHFSPAGARSTDGSSFDTMPGLGLLPGTWIDTHFAQRSRFARLFGVVAREPWKVGLGLDEDTAIVVDGGRFRVAGSGAVYVMDGREGDRRDLRLHVLRGGESFDLVGGSPPKRATSSDVLLAV